MVVSCLRICLPVWCPVVLRHDKTWPTWRSSWILTAEIRLLINSHPHNYPPLTEEDEEKKNPSGEIQTSNQLHGYLHHQLVPLQFSNVFIAVSDEEMKYFKYPGYPHHYKQSQTQSLKASDYIVRSQEPRTTLSTWSAAAVWSFSLGKSCPVLTFLSSELHREECRAMKVFFLVLERELNIFKLPGLTGCDLLSEMKVAR